jgi:uncharacterized membrane protein YeaQ/YmgE (transglycosylase-associated protein family)
MDLHAVLVAVLVGLVAGWLAQFVMGSSGYGLMGDVALGIGGSFVGGWIFHVLGIAPGAGWFAVVAGAFVGAVALIYAQRLLFQWRT